MANSYTTFPDNVQTFDLKTDISSSVYSDWVKYNSYISQGEFANATQLLQSNTELQKCIVDSIYMNKISKTIEELQTLFLNDIQTYIHETVKNKGDWSSDTKYVKYDFVTYPVNGIIQTFECLRDDTPISALPTDSKYWIPRVIQGERGASGFGLSPRGIWNNIALYMVNDFVAHNNSFWQCLNQNSNSEPSDNNTNWLRLVDVYEELMTNFPTSLPANGGDSDTVDGKHANDFLSIDGGKLNSYLFSSMDGKGEASFVGAHNAAYIEAWSMDKTLKRQLVMHSPDVTTSDKDSIVLANTGTGGVYNIIHTGNVADYAITPAGGRLRSLTMIRENDTIEGGQLILEKPVNTELLTNVHIDILGNKLRIFENGGSYRGVLLDITKCPTMDNNYLLHTGNIADYVSSFATKTNLDAVAEGVKTALAEIRDIQGDMSSINEQIKNTNSTLNESIVAVREELDSQLKELRDDLLLELQRLDARLKKLE